MLTQEEFDKEMLLFLQGNIHAFRFCKDLLYVMHLWDDLIDKDKERSDAEINAAFLALSSGVPSNPFFQANMQQLTPLMTLAGLQWINSNVLETGTADQRFVAFMVRQGVRSILYYCGYIIGGYSWMIENGPRFLSVLGDGVLERFKEFCYETEAKTMFQEEEVSDGSSHSCSGDHFSHSFDGFIGNEEDSGPSGFGTDG